MTVRLVLVLVSLSLTACGSSEPLTLATYNAGLAVGFVPGADERAPATSTAVAALEADVVCLQEYWEPEHIAGLEAAAAETFPHRYFPAAAPLVGPEGACTLEGIEPVTTCLADNCGDVCIDDLPDCLLSSCPFQFLGLEKDCMRCVQANVGASADEVIDICTTEATEFSYEGSFGTGILSRHPILSTEELLMDSTTTRRSVLHAVIDAPGGELDLFCTHLTAVFSLVPYPREEGSWAEEQTDQVVAMREWVAQVGTTGRVAMLGDFNAGPIGTGNDPEQLENYEALADGFDNSYERLDGRCTFCPDNPITSVDSDVRGRLIDHILLQGFDGTVLPDRVLDEAIDIESCGDSIPGAHSDHYGVRVAIHP